VCIKAKYFSPLGYTIYAITGTIIEEAALAIIVLWGLPKINIFLPLWALILLMLALLGYASYTYRMGRQAMNRIPIVSPETIIGSDGIVATPLSPGGYVKVKGELWKASSETRVEVGDKIVVTDINGIKLLVTPKERNGTGE
jgi:membrane-bound serine protease (ClpP class)